MDLERLKDAIPFQWKIQSYVSNKTKGICVAYIDSRDAQALLDRVCGAENWQDEYYQAGNLLFCKVGIKIENEWVWKSDTGSESNMEKDKGHASDAFKRACVKWGIGRFLYDMEIEMVDVKTQSNKNYPVDNNGNVLYSGAQLTEFINKRKSGELKTNSPKKSDPYEEMEKATSLENVKSLWDRHKNLHKDKKYKNLTTKMRDKFKQVSDSEGKQIFEEVKTERLSELEKDTQNIN